jgi:hypothetical protein
VEEKREQMKEYKVAGGDGKKATNNYLQAIVMKINDVIRKSLRIALDIFHSHNKIKENVIKI